MSISPMGGDDGRAEMGGEDIAGGDEARRRGGEVTPSPGVEDDAPACQSISSGLYMLTRRSRSLCTSSRFFGMTIPARIAVEPRLNTGGGLLNFEDIPPHVLRVPSVDIVLSTENRELGREDEEGKWMRGGRAICGGGGRGYSFIGSVSSARSAILR